MDEDQAIARLKRGDLGGLETLVRNYQLQAVRTAALITGDGTAAEEIVQAAFLRAAERIDQLDGRRAFGPWFLRSVVNDALKAASRQKRHLSLDFGDSDQKFGLIDPAPHVEEIVETEEIRQAVWEALRNLSARERTSIVMRYYLGMDESEMAGVLNSPKGTVKWWLHSARKNLKQLLSHLQPKGITHPGDDRRTEDKR